MKEKWEQAPLVIRVNNVSKDYGQGRGNFGVSLSIHQGETLGIVGENGAGKTTLIRQMMGFIRSDAGSIDIYHFNAYKDSAETKRYIGYIPGEINFPDVATGSIFLHSYGESLGMKQEDFAYADELIRRMQLDVRAYPKRMSKGMKQKTSIVAAMMLKAPIIIMDEPSIGLDPLMRDELLDIIQEQKDRGATMFMSSNTIEELERVCDRVAMMSKGKIIDIADVEAIKKRPERDFKIEFVTEKDYEDFALTRHDLIRVQPKYHQVTVRCQKEAIPALLDALKGKDVKFMTEVPYTLATYFNERQQRQKTNETK